MPSGKQSKRRASTKAGPTKSGPPPAHRRKASPRVLIAAGVALLAVIVAVVLGVVLTRGSGTKAATVAPVRPLPRAADVQRLLNGIPQANNVLGRPSAPVTVREYIDLQCPYCAQFETQSMPQLISRYVRPGKAKVEARLIAFIGSNSTLGRRAALAAGFQGKLFNFVQVLYFNQGAENSGWLDNTMIRRAAQSVPGVDVQRLLNDRNTSAVDRVAATFDQQRVPDQVQVTPTVLVGPTGGKLKQVALASPQDANAVARAIDAALRG